IRDSCKPSNVEPGLEAQYSILSDLSTSTMKSEPGCSTIRESESSPTGAPVSVAKVVALGVALPLRGRACWACTAAGFTASAAAPAAAPFKKPRRPTEVLSDLLIVLSPIADWLRPGLFTRIFADYMGHVLIVLVADVFHDLGVGLEREVAVHGERLGVSARGINGDLTFQ